MIHYRKKAKVPSILVEFPDGSTHNIPVVWTSLADPDPTHLGEIVKNLRLSPFALLEVAEWLRNQEQQ